MRKHRQQRRRAEPRIAPGAATPERSEPSPPLAAAGRATAFLALGVTALALLLFLFTLAPTVTLVDSGELIAAADQLGVAHPPGMPLYLILAHVATRLPLGNVAQRVNAFSALCAALAAGLLTLTFREAALGCRAGPRRAASSWGRTDLVPPALTGLLLAFSRTSWSYATVAEVYSLNTLLIVLILFLMLRWRRSPETPRPLLVAAAVFGLALGVHHVTVAMILPALALLVGRTAGSGFFRSPRLLLSAGVASTTLVAVYLYLPWAANRSIGLNWGAPRDLTRLLWHVTGRQYQAFLSPGLDSIQTEAAALATLLLREYGPVWLPVALILALAGLRHLWRRDRTLAGTLLCWMMINSGVGLLYTIAEDKDAYALPTFVALALAAGFGAQGLLEATRLERRALCAGLLLAVPLLAAGTAWRAGDRREDRIAENFVGDTLRAIEPHGLLLTSEWQLYSPLLYFQQVENLRPDVIAVDLLLLRRSWYYEHLQRLAPEMMRRSGEPAARFLDDLHAWERQPERYARDPALTRRIDGRFHALILDLVARQLERGPVYATRNVVLAPLASDPVLPPLLDARYALVPRGLVFELRAERSFVDPGRPTLTTGALFDPVRPLDPQGVAAQKVRPAYLTMVTSRGIYLAGHGRPGGAREAFREALALDPSYRPALQGLERLAAR